MIDRTHAKEPWECWRSYLCRMFWCPVLGNTHASSDTRGIHILSINAVIREWVTSVCLATEVQQFLGNWEDIIPPITAAGKSDSVQVKLSVCACPEDIRGSAGTLHSFWISWPEGVLWSFSFTVRLTPVHIKKDGWWSPGPVTTVWIKEKIHCPCRK